MNTFRRGAILVFGLATAVLATGCANMSECQKGSAVGAGIGGVAGSVLSGGSTVGTVGGAVAGGVIGSAGRCR
jgi:osmotically inducible lipoprotein OsmB